MTTNPNEIEAAELNRSVAQFFFEVGFGACYAEATVQNDMKPPFALTDALVERAWRIAHEAHEDPAEFERYLALSAASARGVAEGGDVDRIMQEFYLSRHYDPKAQRPSDNVKAAISFALCRVAAGVDFDMSANDDPAFMAAWRSMEDRGYRYSDGNIEKVHLGWLMARGALSSPAATPEVEREKVDELFKDALNEYGAQGYGRDRPEQRYFTNHVVALHEAVMAALRAPPAPAGEGLDVDGRWPIIPDGCTCGADENTHRNHHDISCPDAVDGPDWTVEDSKRAGAILVRLGIGHEASLEPGQDRHRDMLACEFAAMRTTGFIAGLDAAAGVAEDCKISGPMTPGFADGASSASRQIIAAIRAIEPKDD